jgi:hypothetical protein
VRCRSSASSRRTVPSSIPRGERSDGNTSRARPSSSSPFRRSGHR